MTIESEIKNWLAENLSEEKKWVQKANIERDHKVILEYYGFGSAAYPTYEQIGETLSAGKRQNVEQLINKSFREHAQLSDFTGLRRLSGFIMQNEFLPVSELRDWLVETGSGTGASSIRGLMRLAEEFGAVTDREIYTHTLERLTGRERLDESSAFFIASSAERDRLVEQWRTAKNAPGRHGLCRIGWIRENADSKSDAEKVILLIQSNPETLILEGGEESWYFIHGQQNALVNDCRKVFALVDRCNIGELSANLRNSMNARTPVIEYPPEEIIRNWVASARYFSKEGEAVSFIGGPTELSESETKLVDFLRNRGPSLFVTIRDFLLEEGVKAPSATKLINNSPFVSVDRSGGKKSFLFRLIGEGSSSGEPGGDENERYLEFKNRLEKFLGEGTDSDTKGSRRNEQETLREWLFGDLSESRCAICGRLFSIGALRAAHKKKRTGCTEEERVDPYIVFPVCVFGCDYLYEERYLQVIDGKVKATRAAKKGTAEHEMTLELDGREVPEQWLRGPSEYFKRDEEL